MFGVSEATVSRRWDLLRPLIGDALADVVPDALEVVGRGTVLVNGTVCATWDWRHVPDLFSAKYYSHGFPVRVRAVAQRDAWRRGVVTLRHLLPGRGGYPGPVPAMSRAL